MQAQSGSASDETVDHRGEHLSLQAAHGRALTHVQLIVDPKRGDDDIEILRQDLEYAGNDSSILTLVDPD